jgi:hypothetical protein
MDELGEAVASFFTKDGAMVFLATVLYGASAREIAEKLGLPLRRVRQELAHANWVLGVLNSRGLDEYRPGADDGGMRLIDVGLRSHIREWRLDEIFIPVCIQCGNRYPSPGPERARAGPGRRRKYCSNACRQKAYRERSR